MSLLGNPILLATVAALSFGVGDFIGGRAARIAGAPLTVAGGQVIAVLLTGALALALRPPWPSGTDTWIAVVSGLVDSAALMLLYHGLAHGRVGIVAALTSVLSVAVPAVLEMLLIRSSGALAMAGIALAVVAVAILSYVADEPGDDDAARRATRHSLFYGMGAGMTFGLTEFMLGLTAPETVVTTTLLVRVVACAVAATILFARWRPVTLTPRLGTMIAASGTLDGLAMLAFMLAATQGLIGVSAALLGLNVGVMVLLGWVVLGQRIDMKQGIGLLIGAASVIALAASHG